MGELSLDLASGRAVVGGAVGVGLAGAGSGQLVLVGGDGDGAASRGAGALAGQWAAGAAGAGGAEAGLAVVAVARIGVVDDRRGVLGGAGDGAGGKIDLELVFGEVPAWCDRGLDLDEGVDAGGVQAGQQRPGAIGAVTVGGSWGAGGAASVDPVGGAGCSPSTWPASSASNCGAGAESPTLPAVAVVAITSWLSGSTEACPL
jgi:hypothetical protein